MAISRVTEIKSSSTQSFDDAVRRGVQRASKTLDNVKSAWIQDQEVVVDDAGEITEYQVRMKLTFLLKE